MITIVDYGLGNLGSIANMFRRLGVNCEVTGEPKRIELANKLILPGVGAFDNGMKNLADRGLIKSLSQLVFERGIPILGICLGAQLMTRQSEEGQVAGLGWIDADTVRFSLPPPYRVPHMGWSDIEVCKDSRILPRGGPLRFYFVHSYHFRCSNLDDVLATASYGVTFHAAFARANVFGLQFHPEKSHRFGIELLKRFVEL